MHVVAVILVGGAGSNVDLRAGNGGASCIGMSESEPLEDELDESDELAFELLILLDIDGSSWFRTVFHVSDLFQLGAQQLRKSSNR